jgi:hypothetical protein
VEPPCRIKSAGACDGGDVENRSLQFTYDMPAEESAREDHVRVTAAVALRLPCMPVAATNAAAYGRPAVR